MALQTGWLTPQRRTAMIRGLLPRNGWEKRYQTALWAHRAERARAEDRRG